jgi:hypothetical protein
MSIKIVSIIMLRGRVDGDLKKVAENEKSLAESIQGRHHSTHDDSAGRYKHRSRVHASIVPTHSGTVYSFAFQKLR